MLQDKKGIVFLTAQPTKEATMKTISSLLFIAIAFISMPSLAARKTGDQTPPFQFRGINGDLPEIGANIHERYLLFGLTPHHHEKGNALSKVSLLIEQQRLPVLGTISGDDNVTVRNKITLTYRFSNQTTVGVMREGSFGRGVGFEYSLTRHTRTTVWGALLRSPYYGERIPMIGIKFPLP